MALSITGRDYQRAFADFMIHFATVCFTDAFGCRVHKLDLFDTIWKNHVEMNGGEFKVKVDTFCQLLDAGNHPEIRTIKRDVPKFNEKEVTDKAVRDIMMRRAIVIVRNKFTPDTRPEDVVKMLSQAMVDVFNQYDHIDREVENILNKS